MRVAIEHLEHYSRELPDAAVTAGLTDSIAALIKLRETNRDILVLNIEIPEQKDLSVVKELLDILISNSQCAATAELHNIDSPTSLKLKKVFALDSSDNIILLNTTDIKLFMLDGRDVIVVSGNKRYKTRHSLNYWEERLVEQGFFRCHKSYLINLDKIKKLKPMFNGTYLLEIDNYQGEVAVSRSRAKLLEDVLGL